MSVAFALFTSDSNLLACELDRVLGALDLEEHPARGAAGLGLYDRDDVLQRRFALDAPPTDAAALGSVGGSEALLYHCAELAVGASHDENTQPWRFRRWLFTHQGQVAVPSQAREALLASLPDHLRRHVKGEQGGELLFALFLSALRETGRTEDPRLPAPLAAQQLQRASELFAARLRDAGQTERPALNALATTGRLLLASRSGPQPLHFRLLEGTGRCSRCGVDEETRDSDVRVGAHRRLRTVAVTSHPKVASDWVALKDGETLAVDASLNLTRG